MAMETDCHFNHPSIASMLQQAPSFLSSLVKKAKHENKAMKEKSRFLFILLNPWNLQRYSLQSHDQGNN
jgi:hypothetical protein